MTVMSTSAIPRLKTAKPRGFPTTVAIVATIGLAAAGWAWAVPRMTGMDMGVATTLGSFGFFLSVWVPMMAAMMLPALMPPALRMATARSPFAVFSYVGSYLTVWAVIGVVVYATYRPHSAATAGVIAVAAGLYELTPLKRRFRQACQEAVRSGWELGFCCVGSSAGLMAVLVAFGAMSLTWMAVISAVVLIQKVLPPRAAIDISLAIAVVALGLIELAS
jgi:predicted metal-binding membrane protein